MMAFLWGILGPFRKALAWAAAAFVIIGGAFLAGRRDAKKAAQVNALENEVEAHERLNKADTGLGLSDDDRIARLSAFAAKHRTGSAKKPRR